MPSSKSPLDRLRRLALLPVLLLPSAAGSVLQRGEAPPSTELAIAASAPASPAFDCNGNGIEDSVDIAVGTSSDSNWNAVPDECEDRSGPGRRFRDSRIAWTRESMERACGDEQHARAGASADSTP